MVKSTLAILLLAFNLERPVLTEAQGLVESKLNPFAVGTSGEKGSMQVLEKHWGRVPKGDVLKQMQQGEWIINDLNQEAILGNPLAYQRYNGNPKGKAKKKTKIYLAKVQRKAFELHLMEV